MTARSSSRLPAESRSSSEDRFDLTAVFEFSSHINVTFDLKFILNHFLLTIMGKILSPRAIILLGKKEGVYGVSIAKGVSADLLDHELPIPKFPPHVTYLESKDARRDPWVTFFRDAGISFLVPLIVRETVVGISGFGEKLSRKKLSPKEETYVKSLANIAAAAIEKGLVVDELKQVNRRLDAKVQELNTLFEMSKEFNAVLDVERLIKLLSFSLLGQIGANRFFICLKQDGCMRTVQSRLDTPLPDEVCHFLPTVKTPLLTAAMSGRRTRGIKTQLQEMGIQVLVPLQLQNETKGVIGLGERMRGLAYTQADLDFLYSLGNLAIISAENARLFREAIEKQRMEDELLIAREIQRGLLPAKLPDIPGFDVAAANISSKQVGGDYYDIIPLGHDKYVIAIGDVSGKGTPASLLMANLQATIRALVPLGLSLSELTKRVNDLVCENTGSGRFITFFWGILNTGTRTLRYVNAGHNQPLLYHTDGQVERLDKGGIILGIMKTVVPYEEGEVHILPGETLVLFTDGVSEAMDKAGEEFGEERLEGVAYAHLDASPALLLNHITEEVREHSKNVPQSDDITMVILKGT